MRTATKFVIALFAAIVIVSPLYAQEVMQTSCKFTHGAVYRGGNETIRDPSKFSVTESEFGFVLIESSGRNYISYSGHDREVQRLVSADIRQFIETEDDLRIFTVIDKFGNAVHSRHRLREDGVVVTAQYYGSCNTRPMTTVQGG